MRPPELTPVDRSGYLPLSFAQERLWFLDQLAPGNRVFNMSLPLRIQGHLDLDVLHAALNVLVARHEVLRSRFVVVDGVPRQQVGSAQPVELEVHDVSGPGARDRARAVTEEVLSLPFDLSSGRLLRFRLVRLAEEDHVLFAVVHHAVCDVWSLEVIRRDVMTAYRAMAAGKKPDLLSLTVQYGDFASWQRSWLSPGQVESRLGWWREYLKDAPLVIDLPADHPRPASATYRAVSRGFGVNAETSRGVQRLAEKKSSTLFMVLLSAFAAVIARWSGQEDLLIGIPMAGRPRPELEKLVGLFLNTVPVRVRLDGDPTFGDLVLRVRQAVIGGLAHQDVPFEALVEDFAPQRDLSRSPLVQIAFQFVNIPPARHADAHADDAARATLAVDQWDVRRQPSAPFDLSMRMSPLDGELEGEVVLASDLFDSASAARVRDWMLRVLDRVAADESCRLSELPLFREQEWRPLSTGTTSRAAAGTLVEAFEAQTQRTPDELALRWPDGTLTYRELTVRARRLAARLRRAGMGPEVVAGLCARSPDAFLVGLWGILMTGGAYTVLRPDYPAAWLSAMIADASAPVVVTDSAARLPGGMTGARLVTIDCADTADCLDGTCLPRPGPSNLAYVAFTSGSTGRPKGVMLTHDHLLNYVTWCLAELPLGQARQVPLALPASFAGSVLSLLGAALSGRCLVMGAPEDPLSWCATVREASFVKITPSALRLVAKRFGPCWHGWGCVILSSEPIRDHDWDMVSGIPGLAAVGDYGLTETNCAAALRPAPGERPASGLLGRPAAGARLLVLDKWGKPVGPGTPGELCVGGRSVARGYLGQPGQTADRFIPDPYGPPGSRLCRTGDLARWLPDGNLQLLGRTDDQIKLRGFRIEPRQVENVMEQHPAVEGAVVAARPNHTGAPQLAAWITAAAGHDPDTRAVRDWTAAQLPDYMVPAVITVLQEFPVNANNKLDRDALPEPRSHRPVTEGPVALPATATEQELTRIWTELLDRDDLRTDDNFFAIGGHSLLVIQLIFQVQETFGVDYQLVDFFEAPTIAAMAAAIDEPA